MQTVITGLELQWDSETMATFRVLMNDGYWLDDAVWSTQFERATALATTVRDSWQKMQDHQLEWWVNYLGLVSDEVLIAISRRDEVYDKSRALFEATTRTASREAEAIRRSAREAHDKKWESTYLEIYKAEWAAQAVAMEQKNYVEMNRIYDRRVFLTTAVEQNDELFQSEIKRANQIYRKVSAEPERLRSRTVETARESYRTALLAAVPYERVWATIVERVQSNRSVRESEGDVRRGLHRFVARMLEGNVSSDFELKHCNGSPPEAWVPPRVYCSLGRPEYHITTASRSVEEIVECVFVAAQQAIVKFENLQYLVVLAHDDAGNDLSHFTIKGFVLRRTVR